MFDELAYLVLSCTTAVYQTEISQYNHMNRVWDSSKYHPKLSVTTFMVRDIQGHDVKESLNCKFNVSAV